MKKLITSFIILLSIASNAQHLVIKTGSKTDTALIEKTVSDSLATMASRYEPIISPKLTGFNLNVGTSSGTLAAGDDSRINNGQIAWTWGNHASQGYYNSGNFVSDVNYLAPLSVTGGTFTKPTFDNKGRFTGGVNATTDDIPEGIKQYFNNARARAAFSLTTTGSGAATYNNSTGVWNIPIAASAIDTTPLSNQLIQVRAALPLKVNISDTANMLIKYLRKTDTTAMLSPYAKITAVNAKVNISDTANMLVKYLRKTDTTAMLSPYAKLASPVFTGTPKIGVDTIATRAYARSVGGGGGGGAPVDTLPLSNQLIQVRASLTSKVNISDTANMLAPYAKASAVNAKVNISDTANMLIKYLRKTDTTAMLSPYAKTSAVNAKVNISDTANMLSPYAKTSAVNAKVNIGDTAAMLIKYLRKQDTAAMLSPYATKVALGAKLDTSYHDSTALGQGLRMDTTQHPKKLILIQNDPSNINAQTVTSYTLTASDGGKVITFNNAAAISCIIPAGLGAGFNCTVIQLGAGQVTFTPSSTVIHQSSGFTKTLKQYSKVRIDAYISNTFDLDGEMQ